MINLEQYEIWFVTGSQHLYGPDTLKLVAENSQIIAGFLNSNRLPVRVVFKPVVTTSEEILNVCMAANNTPNCIGLVCWMHTFSPAKMWIAGLNALNKPFIHLHTQFSREIPWSEIDMNFMNLNQSAHGDREFGFIGSRMRLNRKVIVGYWQDADVLAKLNIWTRAAAAWADLQGAKVARFGDNMRDVAVTEGDKVAGQIQFGYAVHGFGVGDLVKVVNEVTDNSIDQLVTEYMDTYAITADIRQTKSFSTLREAARIEIGLRWFLDAGGFKAFTTTFEDLHGLSQLPGLACQRLMNDGLGFGAEGDWKTAALVRSMKVMSEGLSGGTSFMEDYTYHMPANGMAKVLGAHMLEVCPSIAAGKPSLQIHPLSIGGKADPARLVFTTQTGPALNATVIDMGNRFRMIVNTVEVVDTDAKLPKLPVAQAFWVPQPNLQVSAEAWILAGGAHHTGFSQALTVEHLQDFADIASIEMMVIDQHTIISEFKKELRLNHLYYSLAKGF
ncbi:MAG: L-arabinose isomerase [Chloroflexi bacterium HGW-Chloroflexi-10]|nr:MAG: L-arabinose isomerase [Chloroflexi bacterium HGW-Chloroflexi-10]